MEHQECCLYDLPIDTVYRVETPDGRGMYHSGLMTEVVDLVLNKSASELRRKHPMPHEDEALSVAVERAGYDLDDPLLYYGFASIAQLKRWLFHPEVRRELSARGLRVSVYEGPCAHGDTQAVFVRCLSKKVSEISWEYIEAFPDQLPI